MRDLEQPPEHRAGLGWPPLEGEQGDKPLEGLDGAAVAPGRTPKALFRLREPALPDRDLPDDGLGVRPSWIDFAHLPQSREGVLQTTLIEEQASEHLPGVAVLGMPLQPTPQAGFHVCPALLCDRPPDRFQAMLPRGSPEHVPQAGDGGQDQRSTGSPLQPRKLPATSKKTCRVLRGMVPGDWPGILAVNLVPSESGSRSQLVDTFAKALQDGLQGLDPHPIALTHGDRRVR